MLMKAGARKDAMTPEGRTALHIAAQNGHTQVSFFPLFFQVFPPFTLCIINQLLAYVQRVWSASVVHYYARIRTNTREYA